MKFKIAGAVVFLVAVVGCSRPQTEVTEEITQTENVTSAETEVPLPSDATSSDENLSPSTSQPEWGAKFTKAVNLIGKSKADLVAQLGAPTDSGRARYTYEINRFKLMVNLEDGKVDNVAMNFAGVPDFDLPKAGEAWNAINMGSEHPDTFVTSEGGMINYWDTVRKDPTQTVDPQNIDLLGTLSSGQRVQLVGFMSQPILKGEPVFDTDKDDYVIKELRQNEGFTWHSIQVHTIQTKIRSHIANSPWQANTVKEYPISE